MSRFLKITAVLVVVYALVQLVRFARRGSHDDFRQERVRVTPTDEHETGLVEMQRSRRMESRITSDVRDAWTAPAYGTSSFQAPLVERGRVEIATAFTIVPTASSSAVPDGQVGYKLELVSAEKTVALVEGTRSLAEASRAWQSIRFPTEISDGAEAFLVFSTSIVPAAGTEIAPTQLRACWSVPEITTRRPDGPNLLVISIDTLRADRLGCYGYARGTSPNIDRLVARGVLFEEAISAAPWTLPSYASLFTGLYPATHRAGVVTAREALWGTDEVAEGKGQKNSEPLRADVPTLAAMLAAAGWRTAAFYSNPFLDPARGVDRGFQRYTAYQYNAASGVDMAQRWIGEHAQNRWFVFLHLMDPHGPYTPPAPYDERFAGRSVESIRDWPPDLTLLRTAPVSDASKKLLSDLYDGEIAFADAQIGRLLDALEKAGELARTLIVFHSDHGEEFWEHGGFEHGHALHRELLRVPLAIVFPPRVEGGRRVAPRVRTVDVLPTLLDLLALAHPRELDGQSLVPLLDGAPGAPRDCVAEGILAGPREKKSLISGQSKLIAVGSGENQLFDLEMDPAELTDVAAGKPNEARALRAVLVERHGRTQAIGSRGTVGPISEADRLRLEQLGYIGHDDE